MAMLPELGIPPEAVDFEVGGVGSISVLRGTSVSQGWITGYLRPLRGGLQVESEMGECSLGYIAVEQHVASQADPDTTCSSLGLEECTFIHDGIGPTTFTAFTLEDAQRHVTGTPDAVSRVRVKAAGVNPVDYKIRGGYMAQALPYLFPVILGWDAAGVVEQVLKGADPATLPFLYPQSFRLVANKRTARALGFAISPELELRADRVIE